MNALMNVYATAEDVAAAESVLASMQRFGPRPSGFSYNTAIAAHARACPLVYIYPVSGFCYHMFSSLAGHRCMHGMSAVRLFSCTTDML